MVTTGMRRVGHQAPLRLTRRGRVVLLTLFFLLATLASAVLWTTASRADEPPAGPPPTVVVQSGDTLWDIATRTSPGRSPHVVAAEIRKLNGMGVDDITVHAGDTLVVPRAR
ncbi:LysM peptidoglycan-binding domain-containing protein [Actinoplanes sp. NPDC049599]|uniref:LysM peptidoglycan-binding domain-containing protein n=1 Tax=Actinoplanes sp. NPDC049599 TaxID=3363903 RepID=UPI0037923E6F